MKFLKKYGSKYLLLTALLSWSASNAGGADDPILFKFNLDKLEKDVHNGGRQGRWEMDFWIGKDLQKFWFKSEGEFSRDETESSYEFLYRQAFSPNWDYYLGYRRDQNKETFMNSGTFGVVGALPYFIETDASILVGKSGQIGLNASFEKEFMLTQQLVLMPELEINAFSKSNPELGIGKGLSTIEAGVRLAYEVRREFAPYIGVNWSQSFGETKKILKEEGEDSGQFQFVVGFKAWF